MQQAGSVGVSPQPWASLGVLQTGGAYLVSSNRCGDRNPIFFAVFCLLAFAGLVTVCHRGAGSSQADRPHAISGL